MSGIIAFGVFFLIIVSIYAILSLGLNLQWGYTGLFNIGIAGFFAVGAYTSAILTTAPTTDHLGGYNLPFPVGLLAAALLSGLVAFLVGLPTLRLKEDFLAIATIGIAEIFRLIFNNEGWLTFGPRGVSGIPRPFSDRITFDYNYFFLTLIALVVLLIYLISQRMIRSPWGRVLKAIREDETVASALGKNVFRFKMESLIIGSMIMGIAGGLYAHFMAFINPESFMPFQATFMIWIMLIVGGSGSNLGAVVGALVIWYVWSTTDLISNIVPMTFASRAGAIRVIAIAILLEIMLLILPWGLFGEEAQAITPCTMSIAGFWKRSVAKLADFFIIIVVVGSIIFLAAKGPLRGAVLILKLLALSLTMILSAAYNTFFLGRFAATPGKMIFGLQVLTPKGKRIGYLKALGRWGAELLSTYFLAIGYLMAPFDKEKRTLHDKACDTRVVENR